MGFHAKNCNVVEHCSMYILYIDELHPFLPVLELILHLNGRNIWNFGKSMISHL